MSYLSIGKAFLCTSERGSKHKLLSVMVQHNLILLQMDSIVKAELVRRMLLYLLIGEEVLLSSRNRTILRYSLWNQAVLTRRNHNRIWDFRDSVRSIKNRK